MAAWCALSLASFPGLPTVPLEAIKNWKVGRCEVEATHSYGYMIGIFWWCSVRTICWIWVSLEVRSMSKLQLPWCSLSIASFPGLPTVQFLITCSTAVPQAIKNWTVGKAWERTTSDQKLTVGRAGNEATLSNGYMLVCLGIFWWCSVRTICWILKPNSRCSSLPRVAEVPYMEGFIFICKRKLHVAVERTAWC